MSFTNGYKNRYEVYAHLRSESRVGIDDRSPIYSEYVFDSCLVFAREQFNQKYPQYVIDTIRLATY